VQCLWKAAELGGDHLVWLKNGGVMAKMYFVMTAKDLFAHIMQMAVREDRVFQALIHPARPIKFFATLSLGAVPELQVLSHSLAGAPFFSKPFSLASGSRRRTQAAGDQPVARRHQGHFQRRGAGKGLGDAGQ
jgi:hypothetical protein